MIIFLTKEQIFCYILIIPGFGIVSQIVSTFSGKPIFGQCGPLIVFSLAKDRLLNLTQRTICKKFLNINDSFYSISFRTNIISSLIKSSVLVIYSLIRNNPQITKARNSIKCFICFISKTQNDIIILNFSFMYILQTFIYNFKFNIKYLIKLSMLVGISETRRSLSVNKFYLINNKNISSKAVVGVDSGVEFEANNEPDKFSIHSQRFVE
jgi:hypothetical protein